MSEPGGAVAVPPAVTGESCVSIAAGTKLGYWLTVADDGPRLEALEVTMTRHMDRAIGARATPVLILASVAEFLAGCALTGWGMVSGGTVQ